MEGILFSFFFFLPPREWEILLVGVARFFGYNLGLSSFLWWFCEGLWYVTGWVEAGRWSKNRDHGSLKIKGWGSAERTVRKRARRWEILERAIPEWGDFRSFWERKGAVRRGKRAHERKTKSERAGTWESWNRARRAEETEKEKKNREWRAFRVVLVERHFQKRCVRTVLRKEKGNL